MQYPDFKKHDRNSLRLYGYDYSSLGAYYITICAFERSHIFGNVHDGIMKLNWLGEIVTDCWEQIPTHFPGIRLDEWIIMPNHMHGIIWIVDNRLSPSITCRGTACRAPTKQNTDTTKQNTDPTKQYEITSYRSPISEQFSKPVPGSIPTIIRSFKSAVTKHAHIIKPACGTVWQRNYHEHVIRDHGKLRAIRTYIQNNPSQWTKDEYA